MEPEYIDIDENGDVPEGTRNAMAKKALEPKTPLQAALLKVSGAKRFATTAHRTRWRKLEAKAAGADPESRMFHAWLESIIEWGETKNARRTGSKMPYLSVISAAENEETANIWIETNREKVLKKKTVGEMQQVLEKSLTDAMRTEYEDD